MEPQQVASGDGWVSCRCGDRHWGKVGAAGLLLVDHDAVLLQHRAAFSHFGGSWGIPGGAINPGESSLEAAAREAYEEAGVAPTSLAPVASWCLSHPDWSYATVVARVDGPVTPVVADRESVALSWVGADAVDDYPLHPGFAAAWHELRPWIGTSWHVVVDSANVVGSRPDGWWRDRVAATVRLRDGLAKMRAKGMSYGGPAQTSVTWSGVSQARIWPSVTMVTEGRAGQIDPLPGVAVRRAPGSGDDTIVQTVAEVTGPTTKVLVVTADKELMGRVQSLGAQVYSPRQLLREIDGS